MWQNLSDAVSCAAQDRACPADRAVCPVLGFGRLAGWRAKPAGRRPRVAGRLARSRAAGRKVACLALWLAACLLGWPSGPGLVGGGRARPRTMVCSPAEGGHPPANAPGV